jgi:hypothetical protein
MWGGSNERGSEVGECSWDLWGGALWGVAFSAGPKHGEICTVKEFVH